MVAPFPGKALVSTWKYFTLALQTEADFTENIVSEEACKDVLYDLFPKVIEQNSCIDAVSSERSFQAKAPQVTSVGLSARKRRAQDTLFDSPEYQHLQSRFFVNSATRGLQSQA